MKLEPPTNLKKPFFRRKQGASVTEVLVALVLLSMFIGGASRVNIMNYKLTDKAGAHYTASNLAKNRIETIRNMRQASYDHIMSMQETDVQVNNDGVEDSNGKFSRTTTIVETSTTDLLEIQVTIKIMNPVTREFGSEQEYLQSYVARLLGR